MKKTHVLTLMVLVVVLLAPAVAAAAESGHHVTGTVTANGRPVASVTVKIQIGGNTKRSVTGDDGRYYIGGLRAGRYKLVASKDGDVTTKNVEVSGPTVVNIEL